MTPTVMCIWDPATCQWGTQTLHERDAWTALHTHLAKVHGHDVHAEYVAGQRNAVDFEGKNAAPKVLLTPRGQTTQTGKES